MSESNMMVTFDRAKVQRLRMAYDRAASEELEQFRFDGQPLLVAYAKHLLAYLEPRFGL